MVWKLLNIADLLFIGGTCVQYLRVLNPIIFSFLFFLSSALRHFQLDIVIKQHKKGKRQLDRLRAESMSLPRSTIFHFYNPV